MNKVSIIVPVYNMEKYIERCLDSLLLQDMNRVEILVVDDGSTDETSNIISNYQKRFPNRINYFYKDNEGLSEARNVGIKLAKNEYVMFVDPDDYIEFDLVQNLKKYMDDNIDLVKYKMRKVDNDGHEIEKISGPVFGKLSGEEAFNTLAFEDVLLDSACIYLIKKELFIKNNFEFAKGAEHEDFGLIPIIIVKSGNVISIPFYGYNYVQTEGSITRNADYTRTLKRFYDALMHYDNMINYIKHQEITERTMKNMKTYYTNAILLKLKQLNKEDMKKAIQEIKARKMQNNIQINNVKQLLKRLIIGINIKLYLKMKG